MTMTLKPWARALTVLTVGAASFALAGCSLLGQIPSGGNTDSAEGTDTDVFQVAVGDCLNDAALEGEISSVKTIDCAEPHDSEAYASVTMDDGDFPGEKAVDDQAVADCTTEFNTFVGLDYETSTLDLSYFYPTEASWGQGDREILCLIIDPAGKATGSLKGAAK